MDPKSLCTKYGIRPSKKLGQNFLVDTEVTRKMIEAADLNADDLVVEVGPGFGALTAELVKRVKKVVAVETDRRLINALKDSPLRAQKTVLEIVHGDILKISNEKLTELLFCHPEEPQGDEGSHALKNGILHSAGAPFRMTSFAYKVVASLPYSITSTALRKFTEEQPRPLLIVVLVQKEVAQRVCAKPGKMSVLSVAVQYYGRPEIIAIVPSSAFWPEPEVDSAILRIATRTDHELDAASGGHEQPQKEFEKRLFQIVRIGFSSRRRQLKNNLAAGLRAPPARMAEALERADLNPQARAQELSVEHWIKLVEIISNIQLPISNKN